MIPEDSLGEEEERGEVQEIDENRPPFQESDHTLQPSCTRQKGCSSKNGWPAKSCIDRKQMTGMRDVISKTGNYPCRREARLTLYNGRCALQKDDENDGLRDELRIARHRAHPRHDESCRKD